MNTLFATLISLVFSSVFLYWLVQTNSKRRRTHGLSAINQTKKLKTLLWCLVWQPCLFLLFFHYFSGLIMWFTGLLIIGWLMAVIKPAQSKF